MKSLLSSPVRWLFALFLLPLALQAKHIIGGEITYEYVSTLPNGMKRWKFTMHIYRDCSGDGAPFDNPAVVALYRNNETVPLDTFQVKEKFGGKGQRIPPDLSSPCLDAPPTLCVEEGLYEFTVDLDPLASGSYFFVYQRCCRNGSIVNIQTPEDVGATYWAELTALAQQLNNSSPKFKNFPPIVICAAEPINFDHSALDKDGDGLSYSFFTPVIGGGNLLDPPGLYSCIGALPTPPCPPPFSQISWMPPYSLSNPMGGAPQITVDAATGLITGKPDLQGQFVVGIQVVERRNGQIVSVLRREFQFNVAPCTPTVVADIKEDSLSMNNVHKVIKCGSTMLTIKNESVQRANIDSWYWKFYLKNGQVDSLHGSGNSTLNWDAQITFPDTGDYKGILVLNPGTVCDDTAEIIIKIRPDIRADFGFALDSCTEGQVRFESLSTSGGGPIDRWFWDFGDGADTSGSPRAEHLFAGPNGHRVQLSIIDTSGCRDSIFYDVPWVDLPKLAAFDWSPKELNTLVKTVDFTDKSTGAVSWKWQFDAFGGSTKQNPTFAFPDTGLVRANLFITDDRGCKDSTGVWLDIKPLIIWHMPNAFTPNDDGTNDDFLGRGYLAGAHDFSMSIWNRYGEKIFETTDPNRGWNGRKNGTGDVLPNGVYVYLVTFKGPRGDPFEYKGYATIVR